jgi:hypothetical protein
MDLDYRRSFGPLGRFNFTAPAAHPVGFSNGFVMAVIKVPSLSRRVSTQSACEQLEIVWITISDYTLNGDVMAPLFHHLGASSWHSFDAFLIVSVGKPGSRLL